MENNNEIISDLKGLISIVNDGKEGYQSASEATDSLELKAIFLKYAAERKAYELELKAHLVSHGAESENEDGGLLGVLHRAWIDVKEALSSKEDAAILGAIETGETAAIEKYDSVLKDPKTHADHLDLLNKQRDGIQNALTEIKSLAQSRK
ncbi:ferritin-like domain-containing protein [Pedobacter nototheniae]|uniref:ferritin-like domain-containing protein n=1 Tax=Pedobacter nototheniae TaxID=2488994 RepID=UPI0010399443|nr:MULTISPECIES: PA2169 family four-helix-bundle protein [Pedobacter]